MKNKKISSHLFVFLAFVVALGSCKNWSETGTGSLRIITNKDGQTLGYDTTSGVKILTVKGLAFKDLNRNGKLDKYEDWRLGAEERAKDLASKMTVEQIAGLMLYSAHQAIPSGSTRFGASTYKGKPFPESGAKSFDLSDQQIKFLTKDNLRHVLITSVESPEVAELPYGIIKFRLYVKESVWVFLQTTVQIPGTVRHLMLNTMLDQQDKYQCGQDHWEWLLPLILQW